MNQPGSWNDLEGVESETTKLIVLPVTSAKLKAKNPEAEDFCVRIRSLSQLDFVKAINFPIDEFNRLLAETMDGEKVSFGDAFKDHVKTFGLDELNDLMENTIMIGMTDPVPTKEGLAIIKDDHGFVFTSITKMVVSAKEAAEAAAFHPDGE